MSRKAIIMAGLLIGVLLLLGVLILYTSANPQKVRTVVLPSIPFVATPTVLPTPPPIPAVKILPTSYHIFQSFNNCGPAALSMALSHYGVQRTQAELGLALRPYQNSVGDNDDKSVTLEELAEKSKEYGFIPYHRASGSIELMKQFIALDMPVITRTWLEANEDIGHYRVVKGYDDTQGVIIQDDSMQDKNLRYTHADFNEIWEKFNYEYLVLVPPDKKDAVEAILGEDVDPKKAWEKAVILSRAKLKEDPNDVTAGFNLAVALYNIGDYEGAVSEYEKVESRLPFRALWYQTEPVEAYYQLKDYQRVFTLTDQVLNNANRSYSEFYIIRGDSYKAQGNIEVARQEYEKAVLYNQNLKKARVALENL